MITSAGSPSLTGVPADVKDEVLDSAMGEFLDLPWGSGASWNTPGQATKTLGHARGYEFGVLEEGLQVTVYTLAPAGTSWVRLLLDLVPAGHQGRSRVGLT